MEYSTLKLFLLVLVIVVGSVSAEEPLIWKAGYPGNTDIDFYSKEEALARIKAAGGAYEYLSIIARTTLRDDSIDLLYKIPHAAPVVGDWSYRVSGYSNCTSDNAEDVVDCHVAWATMQYSSNDDSCSPYFTVDKSSGQWAGYQSNSMARGFNIDNGAARQYDALVYMLEAPERVVCKAYPIFITSYRNRTIECPYPTYSVNYTDDYCYNSNTSAHVTGYAQYYVSPKPDTCLPVEGNPCSPATGNKTQSETDYSSPKSDLKVQRFYSSQGIGDGFSEIGYQWRHNYSNRLDGYEVPFFSIYRGIKSSLYRSANEACVSGWNDIRSTAYSGLLSDGEATLQKDICEIRVGSTKMASLLIHSTFTKYKDNAGIKNIIAIVRKNGQEASFVNTNDQWTSNNPSMTLLSDEGQWSLQMSSGIVETYDAHGKLISIKGADASITTFIYSDDNKLASVIGPFGDALTYHYDESGYLMTITTPDGDLEYGYDAVGHLVSVTYPNNRTRHYHYEDPDFPYHLTGITDENGERYANWTYDSEGRAILSEHASNAERVVFTYNADGTTTVNDAAGAERIYHFTVQNGQMKIDHIDGDRCTTCSGGNTQAYTYDTNGFVASKTDWNGIVTTYTRDAQGRELSRTEASSTPEARTITTTWDTTLNQPLVVTEPNRIIEYAYDAEGKLSSKIQRARP